MTTRPSLPRGIRALIEEVASAEELTPASTRQILADAQITAEDLEPWADYGHSAADSYGRKLVHDHGFFELMVMSWIDGDMAAIHDHGYSQWGAVRTFGQIEHAVFENRDGTLVTNDRRSFPEGSVLAVSHDMIHQMGNVGQEPYLTLHLYGCYGRESGVTSEARVYDLDEEKIHITDGGVFFNLPDDQINRRIPSPRADLATRLRFKVELLRRLCRMNGSFERGSLQSERERRLAAELFEASSLEELVRETSALSAASDRRASKILRQELRAAASLQAELLRAGLAESDLDPHKLAELLALADLEDFARGYCEHLTETLALAQRLA